MVQIKPVFFNKLETLMQIDISPTGPEAGARAGQTGADAILDALKARGEAAIILATGASQFNVLDALIERSDIDWSRVTIFHLDEYEGIGAAHPASFVRYLKDRFLSRVCAVKQFHSICGDTGDINAEIERVNDAIRGYGVDVAFVGIGENSHLAFNDPPADFETDAPFIRVVLDDKCRMQQANEGWFLSFKDVPEHAISMSINQIMKSKTIICTVPDERKADAARSVIEGEVSNLCPASILQTHANAFLFLDKAAASKLNGR
jgi:glucosamine-6-phosphate deaminase